MKRILLCLLCAALLTGCGKETDPAVAAAQRYQPIVQAVGDGTPAAAKSMPAWSLFTPETGFLRQPYSLEMRL